MKRIFQRALKKFGLKLVKYSDKHPQFAADGQWSIDYEQIRNFEAEYFVPKYALHRPACIAIVEGRFYEPDTHTLIRHLGQQEKGEIVHAGTYFGDMLPSFSSSFARGSVLCFEPVLENYTLARLCVSTNDLSNVLLFNAALSDGVANLRIDTVDTKGGHRGGASEIADTGTIVPSMRIDQFTFENLVCIQLDVEGHELSALNGAEESIARHHPIILVEDNNMQCDPFLSARGYDFLGSIPGLKIWAPQQRKQLVAGFLNEIA